MTVLPGGRPPEPTTTAGDHLAVSAGGGVFPIGRVGLWGSSIDPDDPAVGIVPGRRGHAVVRRSGAIEAAGPRPPDLAHPAAGTGDIRVVRRLPSGWWALHAGVARHLGSGRQVAVSAGAVDLAGAADPVGVDGQGRLVGTDDDVLDDPGPLDDDLVGVVTAPDGGGWWIVTTAGTIVARGTAEPFEPIDTSVYPHRLTAVGPGPTSGLVVVTADGRTHSRGTSYPGGLRRMPASGRVVAISPVPPSD